MVAKPQGREAGAMFTKQPARNMTVRLTTICIRRIDNKN